MNGIEPQRSGSESDCCANWATTTAPPLAVFSPSLTAGRHQRLYASPLSKVSIISNAKNDEIAKIKSDENNAFSQKTFKDVSSPSFDRFYFGKFFFNLQPTYLPR